MVDVLRVLFAVVVVASIAVLVIYALVGVAVAAATVLGSSRGDRSADELDRVLTEILGPRTPTAGSEPRRSALSRRR